MPFFHLLSSQTRTHKRTHSRKMKHESYFPSNEKKETLTKGIKPEGVNGVGAGWSQMSNV